MHDSEKKTRRRGKWHWDNLGENLKSIWFRPLQVHLSQSSDLNCLPPYLMMMLTTFCISQEIHGKKKWIVTANLGPNTRTRRPVRINLNNVLLSTFDLIELEQFEFAHPALKLKSLGWFICGRRHATGNKMLSIIKEDDGKAMDIKHWIKKIKNQLSNPKLNYQYSLLLFGSFCNAKNKVSSFFFLVFYVDKIKSDQYLFIKLTCFWPNPK